jgi:photosystem II stability/assembly factor-like uncharacterized protein
MQLSTLSSRRMTGTAGLSARRAADRAGFAARLRVGAAGPARATAPVARIRVMRIAAGGAALAAAGVLAVAPVAGAAAGGGAAAGVPVGGPVPPGFLPVSMTFVSASQGWVLGTAPCGHRPCTSVVRTTDGGRSWIGIPAPRFPLAPWPGQRGLSTLRFADPLDGFAFGSQLWVTHNGGATWHHVRLPGRIGDLETSAGVVYAAVMSRRGMVTVYTSPAGGGRWLPVPGLPAGVPGYAGLGTVTLHGAAAWIILGNRLYATRSGWSWAEEPVRCARHDQMASAAAFSARRVTLLCVGGPAAGSASKILYSSRDGGARFRRAAGLPPLGGDQLDLLAQPAARHIFIATSSAATWLDVSGNSGRTWGETLRLFDGGLGWSDFGFTTPGQGVAIEGDPVQGSRMFMTWDAGRTWHKIRF